MLAGKLVSQILRTCPYLFCRDSTHNGEWWHIFCHDCPSSNNSSFANRNTVQNLGIRTDPHPVTDNYGTTRLGRRTKPRVRMVVASGPKTHPAAYINTFPESNPSPSRIKYGIIANGCTLANLKRPWSSQLRPMIYDGILFHGDTKHMLVEKFSNSM